MKKQEMENEGSSNIKKKLTLLISLVHFHLVNQSNKQNPHISTKIVYSRIYLIFFWEKKKFWKKHYQYTQGILIKYRLCDFSPSSVAKYSSNTT